MATVTRKAKRMWLAIVVGSMCVCACVEDAPATASQTCTRDCLDSERPAQPGSAVTLTLPASDQLALSELDDRLAPLLQSSAASLMQAHPVSFQNELGYDPMTARNLDLIQASPLKLDESELAKLREQGFAIVGRMKFANMGYGLQTIYANDLPLYISVDPILDAVHDALEAILEQLELGVLSDDLESILLGARLGNASLTSDGTLQKELDLYFSVALSLLQGNAVAPSAGATAGQIAAVVQKAVAASGIETLELFGVPRIVDFSQFAPRGHYLGNALLERYFRAMMWMGRIDFRLIETKTDGSRVFHRRQLDAMLALRDSMRNVAEPYERVDALLSAFVGEHDYMHLQQVESLLADLGASSSAELAALSDETIAQTIIERGYGAQRIMSQVVFRDPSTFVGTLPLDRSFALLGQRYVVDSHVFSDVTFDRVRPTLGVDPRTLPDPLDAAYAALGNSAALPLLRTGLDHYGYAPQLERARTLIDAYEPSFWEQSFYNLWLSSLRALSPTHELDKLPSVARTERWSRRVLNTQLASWAQLRHDTMLYAKQSYTAGNTCEFPDAYVDPYPEAFARLAQLAQKGKSLSALLGAMQSSELSQDLAQYFDELYSVSNILRDMAEQQRQGLPLNAAQMAFVNDAVTSHPLPGCGGPVLSQYFGWYSRLMYTKEEGTMKPTVVDVHTDPGGTRPPKVLHVATGLPRLMVLTVDSCDGPRAYAGLSFAYHEVITEDLKRLTDRDWETQAVTAADAPWFQPLLVP